MGLTTHFDTSYLLKIDDLDAFLSFGQENFGSEDDWTDFGSLWGGLRNTYIYNLQMGEIQGGKLAMAEMLDDSGLKIFEGNSNFTSWQAIKINSSGTGTENDNCN